MHVLQLGPYPPPEGGITRNILAIREELRKYGHTCSIIAIARSSKVLTEPDVYHPRSAFALLKLLFKLDYDILHLHVGGEFTLRILGVMVLCGLFGRGKSVLTVHSGGFAVSEDAQNASPFSLLGLIFRMFERVICVNELMLNVLEKFGVEKEKSRLIYPFVCKSPDKRVQLAGNIAEFAENHKPFLLTVGLLEDTYDLFMQIDSMEKILDQLPDAGLMIVGSGSLAEKLKSAISGKAYSKQILLAGDVEHAMTLHLINDCDILLRTTKFDGDAISIREALHLGTPVIATDNNMRPEGAHLIPIHDVDALVTKVVELAESKLSQQGDKLDDKSNVESILNLYGEIPKLMPRNI